MENKRSINDCQTDLKQFKKPRKGKHSSKSCSQTQIPTVKLNQKITNEASCKQFRECYGSKELSYPGNYSIRQEYFFQMIHSNSIEN